MLKNAVCVCVVLAFAKFATALRLAPKWRRLAAAASPTEGLTKTWLVVNTVDPAAREVVKAELLSHLRELKLEKAALAAAEAKLDKAADGLLAQIAGARKEFKLKQLSLLEEVKRSSLLADLLAPLRENPVVYSIWNYKPRLFARGGHVEMEVQYRIPVDIRGVPRFYVTPVVTYTAAVNLGEHRSHAGRNAKNVERGAISLLFHPLMPWRTHRIGSFAMYPPAFRLSYNV